MSVNNTAPSINPSFSVPILEHGDKKHEKDKKTSELASLVLPQSSSSSQDAFSPRANVLSLAQKKAVQITVRGTVLSIEETKTYERFLTELQKSSPSIQHLCYAGTSPQMASLVLWAIYSGSYSISDQEVHFLFTKCESPLALIESFVQRGKNDSFVIRLLRILPESERISMFNRSMEIIFQQRSSLLEARLFFNQFNNEFPLSQPMVKRLENLQMEMLDRLVSRATEIALADVEKELSSGIYGMDSACEISEIFFIFSKTLHALEKETLGYQAAEARCMEAKWLFFNIFMDKTKDLFSKQTQSESIEALCRTYLVFVLCRILDTSVTPITQALFQETADRIEEIKSQVTENLKVSSYFPELFCRFLKRVHERLDIFYFNIEALLEEALKNFATQSVQHSIDWNTIQGLLLEASKIVNQHRPCLKKLHREDQDPTVLLPSTESLIEEFSSRPWRDLISLFEGTRYVSGFFPSDNLVEAPTKHAQDKELLLKIIKAHNAQFCQRVFCLDQTDFGTIEKIELPPSSKLYIRGDMHSNLASLFPDLEMFRQMGLLDQENRCHPSFKMVFLGDYLERGANDIELMTVLLRLRMINPSSVFLLRGNHEDVEFQTRSKTAAEAAWIKNHTQEFSACYKSFPITLCIGVSSDTNPERDRQYVYCSHGSVSVKIDLSPLLSGDASIMTVPETPNGFGFSPKTPKQQRSLIELSRTVDALGESVSDSLQNAFGVLWTDIGLQTGIGRRGPQSAMISSRDLHRYIQIAGSHDRKIKYLLTAHAHMFQEFLVPKRKHRGEKKVVATVLNYVDTKSISPKDPFGHAIFVHVSQKVKDWTKQLIFTQGEGPGSYSQIFSEETPMHEPFSI